MEINNNKLEQVYKNEKQWEFNENQEIYNKFYDIRDKSFYLELKQCYYLKPEDHKKQLAKWRDLDEEWWTYNGYEISEEEYNNIQNMITKANPYDGIMLYFGEWLESIK